MPDFRMIQLESTALQPKVKTAFAVKNPTLEPTKIYLDFLPINLDEISTEIRSDIFSPCSHISWVISLTFKLSSNLSYELVNLLISLFINLFIFSSLCIPFFCSGLISSFSLSSLLSFDLGGFVISYKSLFKLEVLRMHFNISSLTSSDNKPLTSLILSLTTVTTPFVLSLLRVASFLKRKKCTFNN